MGELKRVHEKNDTCFRVFLKNNGLYGEVIN